MSAILAVIAIMVQQTIATYSPSRTAARSSRISRARAAETASSPMFYLVIWCAPLESLVTIFDNTMEIPHLSPSINLGVSSHFKYL